MGDITKDFIEIMQRERIGEVANNGVWYLEGQSKFFDDKYRPKEELIQPALERIKKVSKHA